MPADVAKNFVTNLILGNDWIQSNNVYILTPEKRIMIKKQGTEVSIPFVKLPLLNYPATLINHITLPPFSEQMMEAKLPYGYMIWIYYLSPTHDYKTQHYLHYVHSSTWEMAK